MMLLSGQYFHVAFLRLRGEGELLTVLMVACWAIVFNTSTSLSSSKIFFCNSLTQYFRTKLHPVLTEHEVAHWFLPRARVICSYVLKVTFLTNFSYH